MFNDKKQDDNVKFRIKGDGVTQGPIGLFSIDEYTGILYVHRPIDREINPIFHVRQKRFVEFVMTLMLTTGRTDSVYIDVLHWGFLILL